MNRRDMIARMKLLAGIIAAIVVIGGLSAALLQPKTSPQTQTTTSSPTMTFTPTPTPTLTPTPTQTLTQTPTPTPSAEEPHVRDMVKAYLNAFSQHTEQAVTSFFTDNGQKLLNHGKDGNYTGQKEILTHLHRLFGYCTDRTIKEINITTVEIDGDRATVQVKYEDFSIICSTLDVTENMQLVKVSDSWKIAKTDLEYVPPKD